MGCDTRLYISSKWRLDDVVEVMENHLHLEERMVTKKVFNNETHKMRKKKVPVKVEVESGHETALGMFQLHFKVQESKYEEGRMMFVHHNTETPLGPCTLLSLGMNDEAIAVMIAIAKVLGGYLEENDCDDKGEMITGDADNRSDGLTYYLKQGIIEGKVGNKDDVEALGKYVEEWNKKYNRR